MTAEQGAIRAFHGDTFRLPVHLIGAGATGSQTAKLLALLGVRTMHAWDPDVIEPHNPRNQLYEPDQVGQPKVHALQALLQRSTGIAITPHPQRVEHSSQLSGVVFVLVDRMDARREIWERFVRLNPRIELLIDGRIGDEYGRLYTICPAISAHSTGYEGSLYGDELSEQPGCTWAENSAITAVTLAGYAAAQLRNWYEDPKGGEGLVHEMMFGLKDLSVHRDVF